MSDEFIDTNVLLYAHDHDAASKQEIAITLIERLATNKTGALSIQVFAEFYSAAIKKFRMQPQEAEEVIADLSTWNIHSPAHADLIRASQLHRRHRIGWWDSLLINSATQLGCSTLWTEDLSDGQRFGNLMVRNPFKQH